MQNNEKVLQDQAAWMINFIWFKMQHEAFYE